MSFAPAGYSDDDEYSDEDFDCFTDEQSRVAEQGDGLEQTEDSTDPWGHPRTLSPTTDVELTAAKVDSNLFLKFIEDNNLQGVERCLEAKKDLLNHNFQSSISFMLSGGSRPIFLACANAQPEIVELLLKHGADLGPDSERLTPVMVTCAAYPSLGVGVDSSEFEARLLKCLSLVVKNGKANVNAQQNQKMSALMFASKRGYDSLVEFLIGCQADLNMVDSQYWTALAFAVDANKGNVARRLLEAGANPDIAILEGPLPIDLAVARGNTTLAAVIQSYASRPQLVGAITDKNEIKKYSELDNILLGLDASEYIPLFDNHNLNVEMFLELTETDLEKMGVEKIGIRKKIAKAIIDMHKKDWDKSSLPTIKPIDRQKGIYLSCADAVSQVANMSQHFRFLSSNLQFLSRSIREKPEMLLIAKDIANASDLNDRLQEASKNLKLTSKHLSNLERALAVATSKLGAELQPVDRPTGHKNLVRKKRILLTTIAVLSSSFIVYAAAKIWSNN